MEKTEARRPKSEDSIVRWFPLLRSLSRFLGRAGVCCEENRNKKLCEKQKHYESKNNRYTIGITLGKRS